MVVLVGVVCSDVFLPLWLLVLLLLLTAMAGSNTIMFLAFRVGGVSSIYLSHRLASAILPLLMLATITRGLLRMYRRRETAKVAWYDHKITARTKNPCPTLFRHHFHSPPYTSTPLHASEHFRPPTQSPLYLPRSLPSLYAAHATPCHANFKPHHL